MSSLVTYVTGSPFTATDNNYIYYIYPPDAPPITGDYTFILPDSNVTSNTIYIINLTNKNVIINDNTMSIIETLSSSQTGNFIAGSKGNNPSWIRVFITKSSPNLPLLGNALIPFLASNGNVGKNKDFWQTSGNNAQPGTDYYYPFSSTANFWGPAVPDIPQYLQIICPSASGILSSVQTIVNAMAICFIGTDNTIYFQNVTLSASNDGVTFTTLFTIPDSETKLALSVRYYKFTNTNPYSIYRLTIGSTTGDVAGKGIYMMQLYGNILIN